MIRRKFLKKTAVSTIAFPCIILKGCASKKKYDLLIRGGTVFDGSGNPGREADIAIKDGLISGIGSSLDPDAAADVIRAEGLAVSPGFIDPHSHTDVQLIANPHAESKIRQGVTTEIGGNCGISQFPLSDEMFDEYSDLASRQYGVDITWRDMDGLFSRLEEEGISLNYATLIGHGPLRHSVVGLNDRPPAPEELQRMKQIVSDYLQAGAFGISSGLIYTPGCFAGTDELVELCRVTAENRGVYATHMRSEENDVLEAVDEAITIARQSGVNLQISHLKAMYPENWSKLDSIISKINAASGDGIHVMADRYPYEASSAKLESIFPQWIREGTSADFVSRLQNRALDNDLKAQIKKVEIKLGSWEKVLISSILSEKNRHLEGFTILNAARNAKKQPYDFIRDLLIEEGGQVYIVKFCMSDDNLKRILAHPLVVVGSDGDAVAPYGVLAKRKPHPRFYGTFPRVLGKYVREEKVLPLSLAVRKMTALPAEKFGLIGRGVIAEGAYADIVVFNPDTVIDRATFENPHRYPDGIDHVIVNGTPVVRHGEHTGSIPGRILKKV
ncbi:N-acyl-D-glutamate deacylase [subsurface metagenome]